MFVRDLKRQKRWKPPVVDPATFYIVSGPTVETTTTTTARIFWQMTEVCSGQIEYGLTTGYEIGTTTAQSISGGYSSHRQTISGLSENLTYHYRTISVNANGVEVRSADGTFVTQAVTPPPTGSAGPRYGKSTWPNRTSTTWPTFPTGSNVKYVPASVAADADPAAALQTWLMSSTNVPDGTASVPTIVVFDSSGGGTTWGSGTTYNLNKRIQMGTVGVTRNYIQLWMYNVRFNQSRTSAISGDDRYSAFFNFRYGGIKGWRFFGGEFNGPNNLYHSWNTRSAGSEYGHAISIWAAWTDIQVMDTYIHNICGDAIYTSSGGPAQTTQDWAGTGKPIGLEIAYNHIDGTGRQGITPNHGQQINIHHNIIEYVAIYPIDAEDESPGNGTWQVFKDVSITDNIIRNWGVYITQSTIWEPAAISFRRVVGDEFYSPIQNFTISRNRFEGGAFGSGNPTAEAYMASQPGGTSWTVAAFNGYGAVIKFKPNSMRYENVVVTENVFDLPADQDKSRSTSDQARGGNAFYGYNQHGVLIDNNDFGNRGIYFRTSDGITYSEVNGVVNIA
jgi:hypothetical protein